MRVPFLHWLLAALPLAAVVHADRREPVALADLQGLIDAAGIGEDFDTGTRTAREVIVYFHKAGICTPDFTPLYGFMEHGDYYVLASADVDQVAPDLLEAFILDPQLVASSCPVAVVVRERSLVDRLDFEVISAGSPSEVADLVIQTQAVTMGVLNELDFEIDVLYHLWDTPLKSTGLRYIKPREEHWITTFRTTELVAVPASPHGQPEVPFAEREQVGKLTVLYSGEFVVSTANCDAESCGIVMRQEREASPDELKQWALAKEGVAFNNRIQPEELPKFTEVGFKKMQVPADVWDRIMVFYARNKGTPKTEAWGASNIFVNDLDAPTYMVNLPEEGSFKRDIFEGIRPILENWVGCALESTACYGIRVYTNGSWLTEHVDTRATHAVSVIIQVDQEVTEPWPLTIYDHAGTVYNITMKPRDMVLYESATCVHGRPYPMNGKYYSNMFVHYRPVDHDKWRVYNES